jgi:hypothetical protein
VWYAFLRLSVRLQFWCWFFGFGGGGFLHPRFGGGGFLHPRYVGRRGVVEGEQSKKAGNGTKKGTGRTASVGRVCGGEQSKN